MILHYLILDNNKEIEKADLLGMPPPKERLVKRKMIVDINDIQFALMTKDRQLEINVFGDYFLIEYTEELWQMIIQIINERERNRQNNQ